MNARCPTARPQIDGPLPRNRMLKRRYSQIRAQMLIHGLDEIALGDALLVNRSTISNKLCCVYSWTLDEMYKLMDLFGWPYDRMHELFPKDGITTNKSA